MKKLKIFLDTSVYSAIFDSRDPNRQKLTQDFWDTIGNYDLYYSEIITEEINAVSDENLKERMNDLLKNGKTVRISTEVKKITQCYIDESLIPEKYENDALLIALTSVYSLDILVSWNFKHLVKRKT
jgi:predicted nucleic acid-binding protein